MGRQPAFQERALTNGLADVWLAGLWLADLWLAGLCSGSRGRRLAIVARPVIVLQIVLLLLALAALAGLLWFGLRGMDRMIRARRAELATPT